MTPARALRQPLALLLTLLFLFQIVPSPVPASADAGEDAVQALMQRVLSFQADDGSFRNDDLGQFHTPWVIQALVAGGMRPDDMRTAPDKPSAIEWLRDHRLLYDPTKPTDWELQILAIVAAGEDPYDFGGHNYVQSLRLHAWQGQMGSPGHVNDDIFGLLALRAADVPVSDPLVRGMRDHVLAHQCPDGTWSWMTCRDTGSVDMTGAALAALTAAGVPRDHAAVERAIDLLHAKQLPTGGFPQHATCTGPNLQSTAWAVWGLRTSGENLHGPHWTTDEGATPLGWLAEQGKSETDLWKARDVLLALATSGLPVRPGGSDPVDAPVDQPPIARLTASARTAERDALVEFDGRGSADPEGGPLEFRWRVNGEPTLDWGASPLLQHRFPRPGNHTVTLEVRDDLSQVASATTRVTVRNLAPALQVPAALEATRIQTPAWNLTRATDPEGDALTWRWDLGDGNVSAAPVPDHRYARVGNHTVTVRVTDAFGAAAEASFPVSVRNLPPRLVIEGPTRLVTGEAGNFTLTAEDPDGPPPRIVWLAGGPNASFSEPGDHEVRVAAVDADGARVERVLHVRVTARAEEEGARAPHEAPPEAPRPEIASLDATPEAPRAAEPFRVEARLSERPNATAVTFTWPGGHARLTSPPWAVEVPGLPSGTYEILAVAESPSGQRAGRSLQIEVAARPPEGEPDGGDPQDPFESRVNLTGPERANLGAPVTVTATAPDARPLEVWTSTGRSWEGDGQVIVQFTPTARGPLRVWARAEGDAWAQSLLIHVDPRVSEPDTEPGTRVRPEDILPGLLEAGAEAEADNEVPIGLLSPLFALLLAGGCVRARRRA